MVARDFFEVLISNEFISITVLKVARKSIGERVKDTSTTVAWYWSTVAF